MKKFYVGLAAVLVIALGFGAVSIASANEFTPRQGYQNTAALGGEKDGPLRDLFLENLAEALGISSADLAARIESGEKMHEIAAEYGYEGEALKELLTSVRDATIEEALAAGLITEEQAEKAREFEGRKGPKRRGEGRFGGGGVLQEYIANALADALGISVEELQAMKENGEKLTDLGYTQEELKEIFQEAREAAIEQALEDGVITEEDLEKFQNRFQNHPKEESSSGPSIGPDFSDQSLDG